jgi:molecular chaperone DnaK (HSP70)
MHESKTLSATRAGQWYFPGTPVSSTNKADRHHANLVFTSCLSGALFSGGTADITVHEKLSNGSLKELCRASGGDCGGTSVDNAFFQILVKLVGAPLLNAMKKQEPSAYLDIFREFEALKRTVYTDKEDKVTISIPRAILDAMCKKHLKEDFEAIVQSSPYHDKMILRYDKMRIDTNLIIDMFKQASERIIELISDVLKKMKGSNLKMIVLVGGFSGCKIIQDNIKSFFPNYRVIVPEDAEIAVLKGAVLFGHKPDYITARIARYTYGVEVMNDFNPDIHETGRCVLLNGKKKCDNIFKRYIKTGSVVELGAKTTARHHTIQPFQSSVPFPIFQSSIECPQYTDVEGCTKLGTLTVDIQNPSDENRDFRVDMIFGNTELKVTAFDEKSGVECATVLDLI